MKHLLAVILLVGLNYSMTAQPDVEKQSVVFTLAINSKNDLKNAAGDFPIQMGGCELRDHKKKFLDCLFDPTDALAKTTRNKGVEITAVRTYTFGEKLKGIEIFFFGLEIPEKVATDEFNGIMESFPLNDNDKVLTDNFVVAENLKWPSEILEVVNISSVLEKGNYHLDLINLAF